MTLEDGNRRPETSVPNYQPMPRQHPRRAKASRINFVQALRFSYRHCSMFKCSEMLLCRSVNNYRRLEEPQYLHLLGQTVREDFFTASYCFRKRSPDVTHTVDGLVIVEILRNSVSARRNDRGIWDLVHSASNHTETTSLWEKISCRKILHKHKRFLYKTL